jgi:phosphomannomutase
VHETFHDAKIDMLDGVTVEYPEWWFNLRASNTEALVRLNLEASNAALLKEKFASVRALIGESED